MLIFAGRASFFLGAFNKFRQCENQSACDNACYNANRDVVKNKVHFMYTSFHRIKAMEAFLSYSHDMSAYNRVNSKSLIPFDYYRGFCRFCQGCLKFFFFKTLLGHNLASVQFSYLRIKLCVLLTLIVQP